MSRILLIYLNLALLAAFSIAYTAGPDLDSDGRFHLVYISASAPETTPSPEETSAIQAVEAGWDTRVSYLAGGESPEALARTLKRAMALNPDGISMPGASGNELLLTFVAEAQRRGVRVTFHGSPHPPAQRRFAARGAGFVGETGGGAGEAMARTSMTRFNLTPDTPVLLVGAGAAPLPGSRLAACGSYLQTQQVQTEYLQVTIDPADVDGLLPDMNLFNRLQQAPVPRVIFWEAGPINLVTSVVETIGIPPNDIHIVSFVPLEEPLPLLEAPYLKLHIQEQPFLTCYLSLVQLIVSDRYGITGMEIPVGGA